MSNFKINTPHAAVIVWNYDDKMGSKRALSKDINRVEKTIISSVSCISIQTQKSKSNPNGTFQLVLAPTKNWISTLTSGSWCCLLMSNEPITEENTKTADQNKVKMFGKIESVRCSVTVDESGARKTLYYVTGVDWGHIFNNILYIDNNIGPGDKQNLATGVAVALWQLLFGKDSIPKRYAVPQNLHNIMSIFGKTIPFQLEGSKINQLGTAVFDFLIPKEVVDFFQFVKLTNKNGQIAANTSQSQKINHLISLIYGSLIDSDKYNYKAESYGYINPYTLQGQHTFWQVMLDNSNPALNEMISEMRWVDGKPALCLYNRIRPFTYKNFQPEQFKQTLRSYFQFLNAYLIDEVQVQQLNIGTNWRDKYNFVEIKPDYQDIESLNVYLKSLTQSWDEEAFLREGFRPFIVSTKQWPGKPNGDPNLPLGIPDYSMLTTWVSLVKEWHTETHRMLNGTLVLYGVNEYMAVGDNIKFKSKLINTTNNMVSTSTPIDEQYILAHIESISHNFTIADGGARTYSTTIEFVRGITVDKDSKLIGEGTLDRFANSIPTPQESNDVIFNNTGALINDDDRNSDNGNK